MGKQAVLASTFMPWQPAVQAFAYVRKSVPHTGLVVSGQGALHSAYTNGTTVHTDNPVMARLVYEAARGLTPATLLLCKLMGLAPNTVWRPANCTVGEA